MVLIASNLAIIDKNSSRCQTVCKCFQVVCQDDSHGPDRLFSAVFFQHATITVWERLFDAEKNSSMELTVIWGNFSCSDLACSDLACSDLGHSDLACSDLGHSDLAHSDLARFFVKILTFFTKYSQLRNSFCTHPNETNFTKWNFYTLFHNNIHILTKRIAQLSIFKFSIKKDFLI